MQDPRQPQSNENPLFEQEQPTYNQPPQDMIETYGGVIKELTDTDKLLSYFELRLQGKFIGEGGEIKDRVGAKFKLDESTAIELVDMIRSIVNQNTHFSKIPKKVVPCIIMSANITITRFMMLKAEEIPLRYRNKIAFECMNLITASLYKSHEGTILSWTKGSFAEGAPKGNSNKGFSIFPWNWNRR